MVHIAISSHVQAMSSTTGRNVTLWLRALLCVLVNLDLGFED